MPDLFGEHLDLNTISPEEPTVPAGMYDLQVRRIRRKTFTYKSGKNAGEPGSNVDVRFVVTNDPEFSGISINTTLWNSQASLRRLSALREVTGIQQDGTFEEWCEEVSNEGPVVRMYVGEVPDSDGEVKSDGTPVMVNVVSWKDIQPAGGNEAGGEVE